MEAIHSSAELYYYILAVVQKGEHRGLQNASYLSSEKELEMLLLLSFCSS